ncbi:MAG: hypothetical protein ACI4NE_02285 [Succinivibrio sp.]
MNSFRTLFTFISILTITVSAYGHEIADDSEMLSSKEAALEAEISSGSMMEILEDADEKAKIKREEEANKTVRDKLLESVATDAHKQAVFFRNYKELPDPQIIEIKKIINEENSRESGSIKMNQKNKPVDINVNNQQEQGLMSSFSNAKPVQKKSDNITKKNKELSLEELKKEYSQKETKDSKKGDGNSSMYRNKANSLKGAFQ